MGWWVGGQVVVGGGIDLLVWGATVAMGVSMRDASVRE